MYNSIVDAIKFYCELNPNKVCIVDDNETLTYSQFLSYIYKYCSIIESFENKIIFCKCMQDAHFLAVKFACEITNNIFVPIAKDLSKSSINELIGETNPVVFFTDISDESILCQQKMFLDCKLMGDFSISKYKNNCCNISEILYTTGTTGKSKGVVITNKNNLAIAENIGIGCEINENNFELIMLPLSHSHALRSCYANLYYGGSLAIIDGALSIKRFFDLIRLFPINAIDFSPSALEFFIKIAKKQFVSISNRINYIEIGTSILKEDTKKFLIENFPNSRLYNFYGSTESGRTCVLNFNEVNMKYCVGKPTKNAKFIVVDDNHNKIESSPSSPGLLACMGDMNMECYWKQEKLTNEVKKDGYIFSNDLAYIENEYVFVLGRKGDIINFGGLKIAPEEIESIVLKCKGVNDCACVAKKDNLYGEVPYLFVVVDKDINELEKYILGYLRDYIDLNKIPKGIEVIKEIPRTSNGKIKRNILSKYLNKEERFKQ